MKKCKISIILPVYNVEKYLESCLKSLVNQTLSDIEIIAVNDGSIDKSGEILARAAAENPDKITVYTTKNLGVSHARNFGFSKASGEYVWFVDSDDYLETDACEKLYRKAFADGNDLVLFGHYEEDMPNHKRTEVPAVFPEEDFRLSQRPHNLTLISPYPWNKLIKRDLFEGLAFPEGIRFEDLPVAFLLTAKASSIGVMNQCFYTYRKRIGFLTRLSEGTLDILPAVDFLKKSMAETGLFPAYEKELEYITAKHFFFRFRQILSNYEKGKKDLKLRLVNQSFDYLEKEYPKWKENPYIDLYLNDYIHRMLFMYGSRKKMLRFIRICDSRPRYFQKAYVVSQKMLHPDTSFHKTSTGN